MLDRSRTLHRARRRIALPRARHEPLEGRMMLAGVLTGVGVMGDSVSVEYFDFPSLAGVMSWPQQLAEFRGMNLGAFSPNWGDIRSVGYEYNWAVPGAATDGVLAQGQHTGLAGQVGDGQVTLAILEGANADLVHAPDQFFGRLAALYNGTMTSVELAGIIDGIMANITTAIDTVGGAGDVQFVLWNAADVGTTPLIRQVLGLEDPAGLARYTDAVMALNSRIGGLADQRGIPVIDLFAFTRRAVSAEPWLVGGVQLEFNTHDDLHGNPTHFWEDSNHPGMIGQGLLANAVMTAINEVHGTDLPLFDDQEIVMRAGLAPGLPGPTFFDVDQFVRYNHAPTAAADTATTRGQSPVTVDVLPNDSDVDGDTLSVLFVSQAGHGSVAIDPGGKVVYTPDPDFRGGTDAFTYTIGDGRHRTATATVTVEVVRTVQIELRPEDLNLAQQGLLSVVLFSTADFDAAYANIDSLLFAGASPAWHSLSDVDGDGDDDLVLHFRVQETNLLAVYQSLLADDLDADGVLDSTRQIAAVSLTGQTSDDVRFHGLDEVELFLSGRKLRELLDQMFGG